MIASKLSETCIHWMLLLAFRFSDAFPMCFQALVQNNLLSDRISVISGKIEEIELPELVDVVVSEPMGYMLFNERMLETFLHAKKWLKPDGTRHMSIQLTSTSHWILNVNSVTKIMY